MRGLNKIWYLLFILLSQTIGSFSQDGIDQLIQQTSQDNQIPGFAYIIGRNREILKEGYFGTANQELNIPVSDKSVFAIASMSKTYLAAAILLLNEQGSLRLSDNIRKYIPEAPDSWDGITIKHLLTHSSGIIDDWGLYSWDKSNEFFLRTQSDSGFLHHLFEQELLFRPGTKIAYSCGPFVLGLVIERITGQSYEEFLKSSIFEPLDLLDTYVDHPYKIIPQRVSGYFLYDTTELNSGVSGLGNGIFLAPVAYSRADVGIRTTAKDLFKFYNALLKDSLLNAESKQMMFHLNKLDNGDYIPMAAGWMIWPLLGYEIAEHGGVFRTGYSSMGFILPREKFIVILLCNLHSGIRFPLAQKIAVLYYPELKPLSLRKSEKDNNPALTNRHLKSFQEMEGNLSSYTFVNKAFPNSFYPDGLKKLISSSVSIEYLAERNVDNEGMILFNVKIFNLRHYKVMGSRLFYTTVYLDRENKIVFIDYPDWE